MMYKKSLAFLMVWLLASITACAPSGGASNTSFAGSAESTGKKALAAVGSDQAGSINNQGMSNKNQTQHENMAVFEGSIFVATTDLVTNLWTSAGWSISVQPIDTESQDVPNDCTLYPHSGVPNQWIGSCSGYILVPRAGATHIGVMVTNSDGSTTMFQVAPPPANPQN